METRFQDERGAQLSNNNEVRLMRLMCTRFKESKTKVLGHE